MSEQLEFLKLAADEGVDAALAAKPNAVRSDEIDAIRALNTDELNQLIKLRESVEREAGVGAAHGIGVLSF